MTKNATSANGEAMSVSRRHLLGAALAGTAISATAFVPAAVGVSMCAEPVDPIIDAIDAFYRGSDAFARIEEADWPALGGEQVVVRETYGAPLAVLAEWQEPALTHAGAVHALRLAYREATELHTEKTIIAMLAAALAFFDAEQV